MHVLIDHSLPFLLAHGGVRSQIEQTRAALEEIGVQTEWLRWWDWQQQCDVIHFFGAANVAYLLQARSKGIPVVITSFFSETCNRSSFRLWLEGQLIRALLLSPLPGGVKNQLRWRTFGQCAHNVVGLQAERAVLERVYRIPSERISVVPLGLSKPFLSAKSAPCSGKHLICTGTIAPVKGSVELAKLARAAQCPILFVGRPYHEMDPYWLEFKALIDERWVKYRPHVDNELELIGLFQNAQGCVLLSRFENWSLAAHEAAACGLPLLVRAQNWSRERFGNQAHYFPDAGFTRRNVAALQKFYSVAAALPPPKIELVSWNEVALQLKTIYERVVTTSR